jgi:hypothetical protein
MLIYRSGFTDEAMSSMGSLADSDEMLILPLDHGELKLLIESSSQDPQKIMTYLRRKEDLLCRFSK